MPTSFLFALQNKMRAQKHFYIYRFRFSVFFHSALQMVATQVKSLYFPYYIFHLPNFANFAKYLETLS